MTVENYRASVRANFLRLANRLHNVKTRIVEECEKDDNDIVFAKLLAERDALAIAVEEAKLLAEEFELFLSANGLDD